MPSRTVAVLGTFPAQLATIKSKYERDLIEQEMSDDLLHDIARLIEDYQRVLDWTATDLDHKFGKGLDRSPYFPLHAEEKFKTTMSQHFASVPPNVYNAIERHQPYQPGKVNLGLLHDLTRVNKHQDFAAQTRTEDRRVRASGPAGSIEWTPYEPGKAGIVFGGSLGQILINGVPVDPATQRPIPSSQQVLMETIYVGWNFVKPAVPVLSTMESLAGLVTTAVEDIRHEAHL